MPVLVSIVVCRRRSATAHRDFASALHHELIDHLRDAIVLGRDPMQETAALASLALAVSLGRHLFPRSDRLAVRRRVAEVAAECRDGEWVTSAVTAAAAQPARSLYIEVPIFDGSLPHQRAGRHLSC